MRVEVVAHRARDRVAQRQRVAHRVAPQVDHAVAQAQRLVDRRVVVERERRRLGRGQVLGLAHRQLDLAGLAAAGSPCPPRAARSRRTTLIACSERSCWASSCASGESSGWKTSCRMPERSRRSMNTRPPWSRRRWTQPATRTVLADARGVELAGPGVAVGVGPRRSHRRMWCITVSVSTVALLAGFHVLQRRTLVAEDGNVPGLRAVRLLELALEAAAAELELRGVARRGARRRPGGSASSWYSGLA